MIDTKELSQIICMHDVCTMYGYQPNRAGYISCPIHNERTPSLKIYSGSGGWHCFGCGAGGNVVDFVMQVFNLSFKQAVIRLANDFGIAVDDGRDWGDTAAEHRRKREQKRHEEQAHRNDYDEKCREYAYWRDVLNKKRPTSSDEQLAPEFVEALRWLSYLDGWFEQNNYKRGEHD